jgi:hypothetical protein
MSVGGGKVGGWVSGWKEYVEGRSVVGEMVVMHAGVRTMSQ